MALPYDMGNAGDLLKHGVLAEFVRWQCEQGKSFRFIDLFGGEPCNQSAPDSDDGAAKRRMMVAMRVRELPESTALRKAQTGIGQDRYYGSGLLVRKVSAQTGKGDVSILVNDSCEARRERLRESGLSLLDEEFPDVDFDAYKAFEEIVPQDKEIVRQDKLRKDDLVLIDPFSDFLKSKANEVIPQMAKAAKRAAVLLFALNLDPCNRVGQKFEALLKKHLPEAWRMTMPPLRFTGIRGESKYHAEVVLAARALTDPDTAAPRRYLERRLERLAMYLADIPACQLKPRAGREARECPPKPRRDQR